MSESSDTKCTQINKIKYGTMDTSHSYCRFYKKTRVTRLSFMNLSVQGLLAKVTSGKLTENTTTFNYFLVTCAK